MNWYFFATADWFGGFTTEIIGPNEIKQKEDGHMFARPHGPYATFSEAKADALRYYRDIAKAAHQAAKEIKATPRPKRSYPKPREQWELDAEHDQRPERSPAR